MHNIFGFLSMVNDYEDRKVDRFENEHGMVSTARVNDSRDPYETAIEYDKWGSGIVIVQTYETLEQAQAGHQRFVELFVTGGLPEEEPIDVGTNIFAELLRALENIEPEK